MLQKLFSVQWWAQRNIMWQSNYEVAIKLQSNFKIKYTSYYKRYEPFFKNPSQIEIM